MGCTVQNTSLHANKANSSNRAQFQRPLKFEMIAKQKHGPSHLCFIRTSNSSFLPMAVKCVRSSLIVKSFRPSVVLMCKKSIAVGPWPRKPNCPVTSFGIPNSAASASQLESVPLSSRDDSMPINVLSLDTKSLTLVPSL